VGAGEEAGHVDRWDACRPICRTDKDLAMKNALFRTTAALAVAAAAVLSACGGGSGATAIADTGTLKLGLTDAPACGYDHVYVTIQKVRINQSASASDTDAGWTDITLNPAMRVDLLTLTNGVLADLGQTPLAAGHYSQLRLVLAANDGTNPTANALVATGSTQELPLTTPSAVQSGVKLNADIDIAANQMADFVLDFNACKSVVRAGNSGQFLLKPVVTVTPHYVSGVSGYVDASVAAGATVSVQQGGAIVKATVPDATGHFVLEPVAPGSYDLVVTAPGRASAVVTGVTVADSAVTALNLSTAPLALPADTDGTLTGIVTTGITPIDATIDATQTLANGDIVDIAGTSADSTLGSYTLGLPSVAPQVAAYSASGLSFAADTTAGNQYTLTATSSGSSKTAGPLAVTAGASIATDFSF
jgi:hypothetical protein